MATPTESPLVAITERALGLIRAARGHEDEPERLALWLEVVGATGGAYEYDMSFLREDEIDPTDTVHAYDGGIRLVVPAYSAALLAGATVDVSDAFGGGLVVQNPNTPSPSLGDLPPIELTGDVSDRVGQVIEGQLNPVIANHGGSTELVAVEGDVAYIRLNGGCVGCGMAQVTLRQGVEAAIVAAVPEIERVVDVTDHAAGTNPYYQPAQ